MMDATSWWMYPIIVLTMLPFGLAGGFAVWIFVRLWQEQGREERRW